jgi:hypothetical protein
MARAGDERRLLQAFATLENDPDFRVIVGWVRAERDAARASNDSMKDETIVRWNQGKAQLGTKFTDLAESARSKLHQMR